MAVFKRSEDKGRPRGGGRKMGPVPRVYRVLGFSVMWGPTSRLFLDVERDQLLTVYKDAQTAH